jgi:putative DNA primase/helicase
MAIPGDAGDPPAPREGTVESLHVYRLPDGSPVGVVQRVREPDGDKTFRQWRWAAGRWSAKAMPEPRPLYDLPALSARAGDPVLLVEGEKCVEAAAPVLRRYVVTTWPGGANGWRKANWGLLAGRSVDIWPDNDEPGRKAAAGIALELFKIGCKVRVIDPVDQPEGWDVADAIREGWDAAAIIAWARPRTREITKPPESKPAKKPEPELPPRGLIQGTDMAFARRFHERHGANVRYTIERGWLVWSGQRWQIDDKGIFVAQLAKESAESLLDEIRESSDRNEAFKVAKMALQKRAVDSTMWLARSEAGVPARIVDFDTHPMILNVKNGIVDLATGELKPHDRTALCTMMAGVAYDKDATCSRWQQFVGEITDGNVEVMDYLQRLCGYLLTASTVEHCIAFLYGTGRNGKSRFIETLQAILGDYAATSSPEIIMTRRHQGIPNDIARLRGVRAVFMNEVNKGSRFDEAKLNELTGGDTLNARFLREEFFDFRPTHKLCIRGNNKPTINSNNPGIWARIKLIPFNVNFELLGTIDRKLDEKLRAELPGILNWCIAGCLAWQKDGLVTPAVVNEAVSKYRDESDTVGRFISECCVLGSHKMAKQQALYARYKDFCIAASERYLSMREFPEEMASRGFKLNTEIVRAYEGLDLNGTLWSRSGQDRESREEQEGFF